MTSLIITGFLGLWKSGKLRFVKLRTLGRAPIEVLPQRRMASFASIGSPSKRPPLSPSKASRQLRSGLALSVLGDFDQSA